MTQEQQANQITINLPEVVGKGYATYWKSKKRYLVCKGSRASKKSKTTALKLIYKLMQYPLANALVVRKTERTLRNSCYSDLLWAINRLKVNHLWKATVNPLELTYIPTGQKILFRGMDDPLKLASVSVAVGFLCFCWIEEAYEITKEADFDMLDESIRGALPEGYYKQLMITFNPWNDRHWLKARFFDTPNDSVLSMTTNYMINEWLDESDKKVFEDMKIRNPRRYNVAGLGNWGVIEGLVYEKWKEQDYTLITRKAFNELEDKEGNYVIQDNLTTVFGLDFGYTNDPSAFFVGFLDLTSKKLYVWDEFYEKAMSNKDIANKIKEMGYGKEKIIADCAEPKSIDEISTLGVRRITGAKKGRDSINNGIQWIQDLDIIIHPRCVNFLTEISNYQWSQDKFGKPINKPIDEFNHLMDAMRYALEEYIAGDGWLY